MSITRWNPALLIVLSIVIPAGIPVGFAAAHPQDDALADAARKAQAEKKSQPTPQKVWTTDDIPNTPGAISIVGTVTPAPTTDKGAGATGKPASGSNKPASTSSKRSRATIQAELDSAKLDLNTATTDLDILTRKRTLDSQSYYGKPNYAADTQGAAQLQDEQDEIDAKKQQVDDAQKKVTDLQAELDSLSGDQGAAADSGSGATTAPAPSSQDTSAPSGGSNGNSGSPLVIDPTLPISRK